jgi:trigger factor
LKANAEKIENGMVCLEVEVDAERFSQALKKAYQEMVKKVNVPGFRKGKTPRAILERYVGKKALVDEAVEAIIPEAYFKAVEDTGIEPIAQPRVELVQAEEGKPVLFKATVEVKPEVKLGQYKDLEVKKPVFEVTDEMVQKEMERIHELHAKLITVEEGTVANGDIATIDFSGKIEGTPFKGGNSADYPLEIGSGTFIPGFEEQLIGMAVNETRDIKVTFPSEYANEELAGKETVFTVTVKGLKRKELVPLDDEFAKDVSEFDTVEELRDAVRNKLKQAADKMAHYQVVQELIKKVIDASEVEIPPLMVENQLNEAVLDMGNRLASQGVSIKDYLKRTNSSMEEMREKLRPDVEKNIKTALVLDTICKLEKIEVKDEDIDREVAAVAAERNMQGEEVLKLLEDKEKREFIKSNVLREKTGQFLVDNAVIKEEAASDAEEPAPQAEDGP